MVLLRVKSPASILAASRIRATSSSILLEELWISLRSFLWSSSLRSCWVIKSSVLALMAVNGLLSSWTMMLVKSSFILARDFSRLISWRSTAAPMTLGVAVCVFSTTGVMMICRVLSFNSISFSSIF